jgi:hypothetical protein
MFVFNVIQHTKSAVFSAVSSRQLQAIVGGNLANIHNVTNFKGLDSLTKEICIGTLKSAGIPWLAVLPALLILPLAAIIYGALFIISLRWRKSKTRQEIIGESFISYTVSYSTTHHNNTKLCSLAFHFSLFLQCRTWTLINAGDDQ